MKLYVAGNGRAPNSSQIDYATGVRNRLLSYAFIDDWAKDEFKFWIAERAPGASVFLDSGAFSAHTKGTPIDLGKYCDYCMANADALNAYAALDVIGDLDGSMRNLREMRQRGLNPVPVYHTSIEPLSVLQELLDGCGYVAIGGMVSTSLSRDTIRRKLDECWQVIWKRHSKTKIHGLGLTAQVLLEQYPFYSADSSSAIRGAGMGSVMHMPEEWLSASGWREYTRDTGDGAVADGVGRVAEAEGKSESAHQGRRIRNIQAQLDLEWQLTEWWRRRGITWED